MCRSDWSDGTVVSIIHQLQQAERAFHPPHNSTEKQDKPPIPNRKHRVNMMCNQCTNLILTSGECYKCVICPVSEEQMSINTARSMRWVNMYYSHCLTQYL